MYTLRFNERGSLEQIGKTGGGKVEVLFRKPMRARLTIASDSYEVKNGTATIELSDIADGIYTPVLHYSGKKLELSKIEKRGTELFEPLATQESIRGIINKIDSLEADLAAALEEIKSLNYAIDGQTVFEI